MQIRTNKQVTSLIFLGMLVIAPYYLRIHHQKVALYETATKRCYVTDTPVHTLPKADQEALWDGVPLDSLSAALTALEDLCS